MVHRGTEPPVYRGQKLTRQSDEGRVPVRKQKRPQWGISPREMAGIECCGWVVVQVPGLFGSCRDADSVDAPLRPAAGRTPDWLSEERGPYTAIVARGVPAMETLH